MRRSKTRQVSPETLTNFYIFLFCFVFFSRQCPYRYSFFNPINLTACDKFSSHGRRIPDPDRPVNHLLDKKGGSFVRAQCRHQWDRQYDRPPRSNPSFFISLFIRYDSAFRKLTIADASAKLLPPPA